MTVKAKLLLFSLVITSFFSCKTQDVRNKILGVWVFNGEVEYGHLNDTSGNSKLNLPLIYDFNKNSNLIVKNYSEVVVNGYKDTTFNWKLKSNTQLQIGNLNYVIYSINNDNLILIDYNKIDTFGIILKRPKEVKLNYSKKEIKGILLSNIWTNDSLSKNKFGNHFEFFDNKTMIYRYKMFDDKIKDTVDNLQLESWGVAEYKKYYFIYNYMNLMLGCGHINRIDQIIDISPTSYTVLDNYKTNCKHRYIKKEYLRIDTFLIKKQLTGSFVSNNTKKSYPSLSKRIVKSGRIAKFEGELKMQINDKQLDFQIDTLPPIKYKWKLNKDGRILILETKIDNFNIKGIHVDYADILDLSDKKIKIRLFNNNYYTGNKKPVRYLLNFIQEFEKVY